MGKPLEGVTVLDLGQIYNAPYCTLLLAYLGAEVIKLEPVNGGEHLRKRLGKEGAQFPFLMLNNNKKCITLNLKDEKGKKLFFELVKKVDVVIENFAYGVMDRLGFSYEKLKEANPSIIYASSTGFGGSGPYKDLPAMDLTIQALSGIMSITGFADRPPVKSGPAIADFTGGIHLFGGVMTALYKKAKTGEGDRVEVSMFDAVYPSLASSLGYYFGHKQPPPRTGNRHSGLAEAPYNVYPTIDGHIAIFCVNDKHWANLMNVMNLPEFIDDPRYSTIPERIKNIDEVDELITEWTKGFNKRDLFQLLSRHHVPCAAVQDLEDIHNDEHYRISKMINDIEHPVHGKISVPGNPIRLQSQNDLDIVPAAQLGEHNMEVYHGLLGITMETLEELIEKKVI
ncbi:CaiB/BaiF CoA-transferase family protein [Neobacillus niacini]|uniref:CaiB/BaiF CoA transferase family protein n=1 Tax=Neobacillus niacini TaxID=86668 RepID=UPI0021CB603D|nr:CoA transferase [Neobacillus niacini]MCM3766206.1 CoA transferase [Neobacillus niacini]